MLNHFKTILSFLEANYNDVIVYVVAMVSAIIVAIGLLKPLIFNKIQNKQIRKVALAFSNVALCFATALALFLINEWNFEYYLTSAIALSVCCIITYWLYENTCLRNLIEVVGKIVLRKIAGVAAIAVTTEDVKEVKKAVQNATKDVKTQTKTEIKHAATTIKEDNDLKGL